MRILLLTLHGQCEEVYISADNPDCFYNQKKGPGIGSALPLKQMQMSKRGQSSSIPVLPNSLHQQKEFRMSSLDVEVCISEQMNRSLNFQKLTTNKCVRN